MGWSDPFDSFSQAVITERLLCNPKRGCPLLVIHKFFVDEDLTQLFSNPKRVVSFDHVIFETSGATRLLEWRLECNFYHRAKGRSHMLQE